MMKLILSICSFFLLLSTYAQESTDTLNSQRVAELFLIGQKQTLQDSVNPLRRYASFEGHWRGVQYGFTNFAHLPQEWKALKLDCNHSFTLQFNIFQSDINLSQNNHFGLLTGLGLEFQRLRFEHNFTSIEKKDGELKIIDLNDVFPPEVNIKRSSLKNLYLTIPLLLEIQFLSCNSQKMWISGGILGGIRLHSKTKVVYKDENNDKQKMKRKDDFDIIPFKADAMAQIGYGDITVWGSYTLTNMFKSSKLHLYNIGLGFSFH